MTSETDSDPETFLRSIHLRVAAAASGGGISEMICWSVSRSNPLGDLRRKVALIEADGVIRDIADGNGRLLELLPVPADRIDTALFVRQSETFFPEGGCFTGSGLQGYEHMADRLGMDILTILGTQHL